MDVFVKVRASVARRRRGWGTVGPRHTAEAGGPIAKLVTAASVIRAFASHRIALCIWVLLAPIAVVCQQVEPGGLAAQVKALNAEIVRGVSETVDPARLANALKTRASLLSQLISVDPVKAAEVVLPVEVANRLRASAPPDTVETTGEWTGMLGMAIEDDFKQHHSSTRWILPTDGRIYEIVSPELPKWRLAHP